MTIARSAVIPDTRLGILMMLGGMTLFTFNDALGKWLVTGYPVAMLLAIRGVGGMLVLAPMLARQGVAATFAVRRWPWHLLRVALVTVDAALFYWAVRYLPLAEVMTIYMSAPLIVTALSVPLLGERVGWRRWVAVCVGFAGVVLVLNPAGQFDPWPSIVALIGALTFSLGLITTRVLRDDGNLTLVGYQTLGGCLLGAAALPMGWVTPTPLDVVLLLLLGVVALGGHAAVNRSLQLSPAAVVVPFQYVSILWAVALDLLVWSTVPSVQVAVGATLIIGSGLFVFHREQQVARGVAAAAGGEGPP
ncbi:DMT family transporter [Azospirillum sp. RWY-5-1]|uniref:DMT family transporter n=1 Tax=Azospirillum oleiclasticum TaxID=2735135 RepID=A0ABX2THM0_9PROT|nr:DMT family transporter [Azospirillum oleiclasticum]NYZ16432.1 DMT family transporter [Azospirillum oleiclasticum]NYZ23852.1 DMT family transporter [Azospirillum oleiclasticum]